MIKQSVFSYRIIGNHPRLRRINRKCITYDEVIKVKDGLLRFGYIITIKDLDSHDRNKIDDNYKK